MNLKETIQSLEQNNTLVALDIGVHQYCDIDSNCPVAVELRKVINESGITLEQLLEGYASYQETLPKMENISFPEFSGKAMLNIAGQSYEIDLTGVLQSQLNNVLLRKIQDIGLIQASLQRVGESLYWTYIDKIGSLRNKKELPQLEFSTRDLIKAGCLITRYDNRYMFLFPRLYNPQWIVTNGVRYELAPSDAEALKGEIFVCIIISKERKIMDLLLIKPSGDKFGHYHGRGGDCWGQVRIPTIWDGTLKSLINLVTLLMGSLATINKDSLMERQPSGMSHIEELFSRSKKLGEEGRLEERERPEEVGWRAEHQEEDAAPQRRGWRTG